MIVCICNDISNKDILKYISLNNSSDFEEISRNLPCCNQCEVCRFDIQDIIESLPVLQQEVSQCS